MVSEERSQRIVLARHAETEWSRSGRHTGRTDIELTAAGREAAVLLGHRIRHRRFDHAGSSPLTRARTTARLAGFDDPVIDDDLLEWDYGDYEGRRTSEIRTERPGWSVWTGAIPNGETIEQVSTRADRVIARASGPLTVVFAHAHLLRVLTARWLGLPPSRGRSFTLEPASLSVLGHEREERVIELWNVVPSLPPVEMLSGGPPRVGT